MTAMVKVSEQYVEDFEQFIKSLPTGAVTVEPLKTLSTEVKQRIKDYKDGVMKTTSFRSGLDSIRENLVARL